MPDPASAIDNRILIVHPKAGVREDLASRLTGFGYQVVGAVPSAAEGLDLRTSVRPDLVLLDDSQSADADPRRQWTVPVILLLASGDETALRRHGITGSFGYVVAPYPDRELRMNLEMALLSETVTTQAHALEERFFAVNIDLLCCLGFDGHFKRLNPAWERTLGYSARRADGQAVHRLRPS